MVGYQRFILLSHILLSLFLVLEHNSCSRDFFAVMAHPQSVFCFFREFLKVVNSVVKGVL